MDRVSDSYAMKPEMAEVPFREERCTPSFPGSWSSGRDRLYA
jgi:hypothetical protein